MLFHELGHVQANHRLFVVEQKLGKRAAELGFADAGGPRKINDPMGRY
jgi:hypothetical protein